MRTTTTTTRRQNGSPEKAEQAGTVRLLQLLGADVYTIGTRRPRGRTCPQCGTFVPEHAGTCQTPGLPDLLVFLPPADSSSKRLVCFVEQKREGGRLSPEQRQFRVLAQTSSAVYVTGTAADVVTWLGEHGYLRRRTKVGTPQTAPIDGKAAG